MTDVSTEPASRKGLILINTGPGKGKTTAALGTALRAVGCGMRVLFLQFLKGSWHYGELDAVLAHGDNFVLKQLGRGFVKVGGAETDPEDQRMVEEAWEESKAAILSSARFNADDGHGSTITTKGRLAFVCPGFCRMAWMLISCSASAPAIWAMMPGRSFTTKRM